MKEYNVDAYSERTRACITLATFCNKDDARNLAEKVDDMIAKFFPEDNDIKLDIEEIDDDEAFLDARVDDSWED